MCNQEGSSSRTRNEEKRCHYCRQPCLLVKECEKRTKDVAKEQDQSSKMQLTADLMERNWMNSWPETIQTNVEGQLKIGDTYCMTAGSYMEDNLEELNL